MDETTGGKPTFVTERRGQVDFVFVVADDGTRQLFTRRNVALPGPVEMRSYRRNGKRKTGSNSAKVLSSWRGK